MARTKVVQTLLLQKSVKTITLTAADVTNLNYADMTGYEVLLAFNSTVGSEDVTINSAADPTGRTGDITAQAIAAGAWLAFGPFKVLSGWAQGGGSLNMEASDVGVQFAWVSPPFV